MPATINPIARSALFGGRRLQREVSAIVEHTGFFKRNNGIFLKKSLSTDALCFALRQIIDFAVKLFLAVLGIETVVAREILNEEIRDKCKTQGGGIFSDRPLSGSVPMQPLPRNQNPLQQCNPVQDPQTQLQR